MTGISSTSKAGVQVLELTVREDSVDLLSSDLALRCGDRGEAEVSGSGVVGVSLVRSCGREQPPVSMSQSSGGAAGALVPALSSSHGKYA